MCILISITVYLKIIINTCTIRHIYAVEQPKGFFFNFFDFITYMHGTAQLMLRTPWSIAIVTASMHLPQNYMKMKPRSWQVREAIVIYVPHLFGFNYSYDILIYSN